VTSVTLIRWPPSLLESEFYLLDLGMTGPARIVEDEGDEAYRHYDP
jgi:hypothetical protein